jgi:hypothetical protein
MLYRQWTLLTLWGIVVIASSALRAADAPTSGGELKVGGRAYKLTRIVAYEVERSGEKAIVVLTSDRNLPLGEIKKALVDGEGSDDSLSLSQPYLKLLYSTSGEILMCQAWADNASFSTGADGLAGQLKLNADHVVGSATMPEKPDSQFKRSFALRFDLPLGLEANPSKSPTAKVVKPSVSGKFTGNGKPARLAYVTAHRREPFADKPAISVVFTEKDHAKDPRPENNASFGRYGSALILSMDEQGSIFGCEVAHAAHAKKPFSSLGRIRTADFDLGNGHVQGRVSTDGEEDTFDQKWEVDLQFAAPLPPPAASPTAGNRPAPGRPQSSKPALSAPRPAKSTVPDKPAKDKPDSAALNVHDLPLPKDAANVQYKTLVEQMVFTSSQSVNNVAAEFAKKLTAQGWTSEGGDLVTPQSAILNRTRGDATLTIMAKPAGSDSQITIFATGLDWSEKTK